MWIDNAVVKARSSGPGFESHPLRFRVYGQAARAHLSLPVRSIIRDWEGKRRPGNLSQSSWHASEMTHAVSGHALNSTNVFIHIERPDRGRQMSSKRLWCSYDCGALVNDHDQHFCGSFPTFTALSTSPRHCLLIPQCALLTHSECGAIYNPEPFVLAAECLEMRPL